MSERAEANDFEQQIRAYIKRVFDNLSGLVVKRPGVLEL